MCRTALGQQVDGCFDQCFGDDTLIERCGPVLSDQSPRWTVYSTEPQISTGKAIFLHITWSKKSKIQQESKIRHL